MSYAIPPPVKTGGFLAALPMKNKTNKPLFLNSIWTYN